MKSSSSGRAERTSSSSATISGRKGEGEPREARDQASRRGSSRKRRDTARSRGRKSRRNTRGREKESTSNHLGPSFSGLTGESRKQRGTGLPDQVGNDIEKSSRGKTTHQSTPAADSGSSRTPTPCVDPFQIMRGFRAMLSNLPRYLHIRKPDPGLDPRFDSRGDITPPTQ